MVRRRGTGGLRIREVDLGMLVTKGRKRGRPGGNKGMGGEVVLEVD